MRLDGSELRRFATNCGRQDCGRALPDANARARQSAGGFGRAPRKVAAAGLLRAPERGARPDRLQRPGEDSGVALVCADASVEERCHVGAPLCAPYLVHKHRANIQSLRGICIDCGFQEAVSEGR
ncbi:MAG TPA: hypothetical protein VLS47_05705 [Gallionella sp.]|nr:hypothetical protein [Gallionella sp.]